MKTFISILSITGLLFNSWFFGIVALVFIALLILLIQKSAVCLLESKAVYSPDKVLKKKKPFYTNRTRWDHIRKKALIHKIAQEKFSSFINFIKPYYFTDRKMDYTYDEERRFLIHKLLK
jgi:hypothetical protein